MSHCFCDFCNTHTHLATLCNAFKKKTQLNIENQQMLLLPLRLLQHSATLCNKLQHSASLCITLHHSATPCNTLQ